MYWIYRYIAYSDYLQNISISRSYLSRSCKGKLISITKKTIMQDISRFRERKKIALIPYKRKSKNVEYREKN